MTRTKTVAASIAVFLVMLLGGLVTAETTSYFDKAYECSALKTFGFKTQRRIPSDPIAKNPRLGDDIRAEIVKQLEVNGFEQASEGKPADFLVAFYVGLKQKHDVHVMDYDYARFRGWRRWAWRQQPSDVDVWRIPYTDSTLIIDLIDGQTDQLIWRGSDTNTIDMTQPDKRLDKAVDSLVKKLMEDTGAPH